MAFTCTFFTSYMFARDVFCITVAGRKKVMYSKIVGAFNHSIS